MVLPFVSLMLLYFLVLLYGQGTAASVLLEKTSKLMDLFLVSVEPTAMVLGKVLATALAGLLQLAVWILSLMGGFAAGGALARQTAPGVTLPLLEVLRGAGRLAGLFSVPAMLEAVGLLLAGFLLYCSLSAIGGSLAGKVEDLSSTNVLFSLVLVASFLCCMFAGDMDGMTSSARWLDYVPFTGRAGNAQPGPAGADVPDGGPCVPGAGGRLRRTADGPGRPCVPADVPV